MNVLTRFEVQKCVRELYILDMHQQKHTVTEHKPFFETTNCTQETLIDWPGTHTPYWLVIIR